MSDNTLSPIYDAYEFESLEAALTASKAQAGFPQHIGIGDTVTVNADWGSHAALFKTTITWICDSDEAGFAFGVAMPIFWGMPLLSISKKTDGWELILVADETPSKREWVNVSTIAFEKAASS